MTWRINLSGPRRFRAPAKSCHRADVGSCFEQMRRETSAEAHGESPASGIPRGPVPPSRNRVLESSVQHVIAVVSYLSWDQPRPRATENSHLPFPPLTRFSATCGPVPRATKTPGVFSRPICFKTEVLSREICSSSLARSDCGSTVIRSLSPFPAWTHSCPRSKSKW